MVQKALNAVCDTFDGCETLAYADLSTQLVLATNEAASQTRDTLNDLCAEAKLVLDVGHIAVVGTGTGFRLFFRDRTEPSDCLICVCSLEADIAKLFPAAQQCLAEIASGDSGA